jgi:DNA-binding transcriptional LysR family regulator
LFSGLQAYKAAKKKKMNIKQLLYFIAIAENPSISAAAKKLGISQPPLSAQLQLLEKEFGVRLTERGPKGVSLTEAGRMLYKRAVSIVALSDAAIKDLKDYSSGLRGTLRLGTGSSCGMALLGGRLAAFSEAYPLISFEIHEGAAFAMLDLLAANVIDVAVVRTPFQTESYHCEFLAPEPMVAAATEKFFPSPSPDVISLSELEGLPLVYYRRMEHVIMAAFEKAAVEPYAYCINDDARTCRQRNRRIDDRSRRAGRRGRSAVHLSRICRSGPAQPSHQFTRPRHTNRCHPPERPGLLACCRGVSTNFFLPGLAF